MKIKDCPKCVSHFLLNPFIIEACASVGISRGKSTKEMIQIFYSAYHNNNHRELTDAV